MLRRRLSCIAVPSCNRPHPPSVDGAGTMSDAQTAHHLSRSVEEVDLQLCLRPWIRAQRYFGHEVSVLTYNSALRQLRKRGLDRLALAIYNDMLQSSVAPDASTFSLLLTIAARRRNPAIVAAVRHAMTARGFKLNEEICCSQLRAATTEEERDVLVQVAAKHSLHMPQVKEYALLRSTSFAEAYRRLEDLSRTGVDPSVRGLTHLLSLCCKAGNEAAAAEVFLSFEDSGLTPDAAAWSCLMQLYVRNGNLQRTAQTFVRMTASDIKPTDFTFSIFLAVVANNKTMSPRDRARVGLALWQRASDERIDSIYVSTALMKVYGQTGCQVGARCLRENLHRKGVKMTKPLSVPFAKAVRARKGPELMTTSFEDALQLCLAHKTN
ncbi:putative pentatricopeptide repeat-containing protein, mitochondrial [Diplonema papillatum]|nr:putative pentatricopeptide repeat-containing protein, mitochondrial [Diplonema papillatum]